MTAVLSLMLGTSDIERLHAWCAGPGRFLVNFDVEDARAVEQRADERGATWIARVEDRDGSPSEPPPTPMATRCRSSSSVPSLAQRWRAGMSGLAGLRTFSGFSVNDLATAQAFYVDVLSVADETEHFFSLKLPEQTMLVYGKGAAHTPASYTVLNFSIADVESVVDALTAGGVEFLPYEGPARTTSDRA